MHPDRIPGRAWLLLLLLGIASLAQAARIEVRTDRDPVPLDESFQIIFSVAGEVGGQPDFSVLEKDFQVLGTSRSLRTTFVNGKMQRSNEYLVSAMARRSGELTIPPVRFGKDLSPPATIRVTEATGGGQGESVFLEVSVDVEAPYVQQQVLLTVRIFHRIQWREASLSEPEFRGGEVLVQKLGDDRNYTAVRDGVQWQVIERRYALFPQGSGVLEMEPLVLNMRVPTGERKARDRSPFGDPFFDDFFSRRTYSRKVVRSRGIELKVRPVPASFSGSHWLPARDLRLQEEWSAPLDDLTAGEPVTRTLTLVAEGVSRGQLPELAMADAPGLRIYPDEVVTGEQATAEGVVSTSRRKFAVIPVEPGEHAVPPLELRWWDVIADRERITRLPRQLIRVTGSAASLPAEEPGRSARVQESEQVVEQGRAGASSPLPGQESDRERWLILGNLLFMTLWLVTLVAWWRNRRKKLEESAPGSGVAGRSELNERLLWKTLHQAALSGDARRLREALLALAPVIWPQEPPRSIEAMARLAGEPLATQLERLSRHLYAGGDPTWDGQLIENGLKALRGSEGKGESGRRPALRPLYPTA